MITRVSKVVARSVTLVRQWQRNRDCVPVHFSGLLEPKHQPGNRGGVVLNSIVFYQQKARVSIYPCFWKTFLSSKRDIINFTMQLIWKFPEHHLCVKEVFLHFGYSFWNWRIKKYPQNIFSALSAWLHNKYTIKICTVINEYPWIAQFNCLNFLLKIRGNESIHYSVMLLPIMTDRISS